MRILFGRVEGDESEFRFILRHDHSGSLLRLDPLVFARYLLNSDRNVEGRLRSDGLMLENSREGWVKVQLVRH